MQNNLVISIFIIIFAMWIGGSHEPLTRVIQQPFHFAYLLESLNVGNKMRKLTTQEFIERARKVHGDKYDYSKVEYLTAGNKVCIICPEHGEFWQNASNHLNGSCCPNCQVSFGENLVKVFLDEHNIDYIPQYRIKNENLFCNNEYLIVDFYLPSFNAIIEYNGVQHYQPIKRFGGYGSFNNQIERDNALRQYCKEYKIKLIEIPYTQKKNINETVKKELKIK